MGCGSARLINRAVCLSDFWRYQLPVPESTSTFASDANVAYRREVLEALRDVWEDDFHETVVNGALLERGHQIWLTPAATIYQKRGKLTWSEVLQERIVWGRSYAGTRVKGIPLSKRLVYAALCPARRSAPRLRVGPRPRGGPRQRASGSPGPRRVVAPRRGDLA